MKFLQMGSDYMLWETKKKPELRSGRKRKGRSSLVWAHRETEAREPVFSSPRHSWRVDSTEMEARQRPGQPWSLRRAPWSFLGCATMADEPEDAWSVNTGQHFSLDRVWHRSDSSPGHPSLQHSPISLWSRCYRDLMLFLWWVWS